MPFVKDFASRPTNDLLSIQLYPQDYYVQFSPATIFEKWAVIEINHLEPVPNDLDAFIIPSGLYAVFYFKGASTDPTIFQYIFTEWLPNADYHLDHRPHFEVLGEKYKNNDPSSEEEIWIPIKNK